MLISYNRLKELIDFDYTPSELDNILTMMGIEVEAIINYKEKYNNFYVGEVLSKEAHPQADKLSLCEVNFGVGQKTVVCGAPNVAAGQKIMYASTGAIVPNGGFKIEKRKIRGIESEGMICSQYELDLGEDTGGIWVLPEDAQVGQPLTEFCNINDVILEISVTPNRPDCLNHFGIARLIAAYKNEKFNRPTFTLERTGEDSNKDISIEVQSKELCNRYVGLVIKGIKQQASPDWLQNKIKMLGLRPVNAVVDVTNYVMYETGQPLHAFDLDKIKGNKVIIKTAQDGEKFTPLDDKERQLDSSMLMICDGERSIAIAGVMGGANSEIDNNTQNILIESAYFNPQSVRRTAKKVGLSTDASYRFERGVDYSAVPYAAEYAASLINQICGGKVACSAIDIQDENFKPNEVELRFEKANKLIGINVSPERIIDIMKSLEFEIVAQDAEKIRVKVPTYRVDIAYEVDLIEEVAIMYNYDNIQPEFSTNINFSNSLSNSQLLMPKMRAKVRNYLVQNGFTEVLTQNIIDPTSARLFAEESVVLSNPLGEEMSVMRPSLIPSILKTIERNIRHGNTNLRIFEIGKNFELKKSTDKDGKESSYFNENEEIVIALSGSIAPFDWNDKERQVDYYDIKGVLEDFIDKFGITSVKFKKDDYLKDIFSANALTIHFRGKPEGKFGEVSKKLLKQFGIEKPVYLITLKREAVYTAKLSQSKYLGVSQFPAVKRDVGFILPKATEAEPVRAAIAKAGGKYLSEIEIFDIFVGEKIGLDNKYIAFALTYLAPDKTLTDQEVDDSIKAIIAAVEKQFNAKLRDF